MKNRILYFIIYLVSILAIPINIFGQYRNVKISTEFDANFIFREGYQLIFSEEFNGDSINNSTWGISDYFDDGTIHCTDQQDFPFTMNPENVIVENGFCKILLTSQNYAGCDCSAGEIKSYSIDTSKHLTPWSIDQNYYIEIGVSGLPIMKGIGSAAWLFTPGPPEYNEIDIWETNGKEKDRFQSTYWWQENNISCTDDELNRNRKSKKIKVRDKDQTILFGLFNRKVNLSNTYLRFGLEITNDNLFFSLNEVRYWKLNLDKSYSYSNSCDLDLFDSSKYPKGIRIGTGPNSIGNVASNFVDKSKLPLALNIDYIRVYVKENEQAIKINSAPTVVCNSQGFNIGCTYFPGVKYEWNSDAFDLVPNSHDVPYERWANFNYSSLLNTYHPIYLTCTFPDGYIEIIEYFVYIVGELEQTLDYRINLDELNCNYNVYCSKDYVGQTVFWSFDMINWSVGIETASESLFGTLEPNTNYSLYIRKSNPCDEIDSIFKLDLLTPDSTKNCINSIIPSISLDITSNFQFIPNNGMLKIQHPNWQSHISYNYKIMNLYGVEIASGKSNDQYIDVKNIGTSPQLFVIVIQYADGISASDSFILE